MFEGTATLVTSVTMVNPTAAPNSQTSVRGSGIEGGASRRAGPGDVVIIPGHTPHWWSELERAALLGLEDAHRVHAGRPPRRCEARKERRGYHDRRRDRKRERVAGSHFEQ